MVTSTEQIGLQKGTNWWGAFVIGLAGTILVVGIAPFVVQVFGAASIPLFAGSDHDRRAPVLLPR